ncbi:hypothetical protein GOP47_0011613 [Adiantum capillus-veneris]|uniref:Glucan endo-1,3-beta-D-glucosidase n=1 Tax=Adiantum capillus-veneris TaxID=13818 RepID=A0A9D4ZHU4_ADICA|nr:hypothetical protein GOP47_0011613 [Adiantum capillus-veneris]
MAFFLSSLLFPLSASRLRRPPWKPTLLFVLLSELFADNSVVAVNGLSNLGINYGISVIVGIGNEDVASLTNTDYAANWVQTNIAYYYPATQIAGILVGNEVFSGDDSQLKMDLLLAMENLYVALQNLGLDAHVFVSTAHSQAILSTSFPPSSGSFASDIGSTYLSPMLKFLENAGAPFMINPYPYFAYKANPNTVSLQYALSAAPSTSTGAQTSVAASSVSATVVTDPNTGLAYYNLLDAEVDAVYAALAALGYNDIEVIVSETGWPSAGDSDEAGATLENAQAYNSNLIARLQRGQGTPAKPNVPLVAFIFALFNEDMKYGPTSERHYGLFNPDRTPAYDFGLLSTSSKSTVDPYSVYYHISSSIRWLPQLTTYTLAVAAFLIHCFLLKDLVLC